MAAALSGLLASGVTMADELPAQDSWLYGDTDTATAGQDVIQGDPVTASAVAGRVTTVQIPASGATSVEILDKAQYGNVTVNPDNSLAVVLTGTTQTEDLSFKVRLTYADGTVEDRDVLLDVTEGAQAGGWASNEFYKLATDSQDRIVVEHGENHRTVYVSASDDALTLADIAAREGVDVSQVTGQFLMEHSQYGSSEDMAIAQDACILLWPTLTGGANNPEGSSHWLLLERGHEYNELSEFSLLASGANGESELHPLYFGAYGDGDRPVVDARLWSIKLGSENVVFQDLHFTSGMKIQSGSNFIFDNVTLTDTSSVVEGFYSRVNGVTFRNVDLFDVAAPAPPEGETWSAHRDRVAGFYISNTDNLLIENSFFDHSGWSDDYLTGNGQAPNIYSHNLYLQYDNSGVTLRDNIVMRGSGNDAQIRSGGFIEGNLFLDSNAGVMFGSGVEENGVSLGNYTLFLDNVLTSGAHRELFGPQGGYTLGITNEGHMATLIGNIVTHLANPDDPEEQAAKTIVHPAIGSKYGDEVHDDTTVYNWTSPNKVEGFQDQNIEGLDKAVLDEATIQIFTAQLLGKPSATIADLATFLRAQANGSLDDVVDADVINAFFQTAFGLKTDLRAEAATLRFIPNELGDGIRWDNRLNWSTGDLPGVQDGDSVDLGGNWVSYEGTTTIKNLDFGSGGRLSVTNGLLSVEGLTEVEATGAWLSIDKAGQFWTNGYSDTDVLRIDAAGGRYANTGLSIGKIRMDISDNAQVLLATDGAEYIMRGRSHLTVTGGDAKVGFDGQAGGTAALLMTANADLKFVAEGGKIGTIGEFYSGHYEAGNGGVRSGVNLGDATLEVDVSDVASLGTGKYDLIHVDELIGTFGTINIVGLAPNQSAKVVINYTTDKVTLILGEVGKGDGLATLQLVGQANSAMADRELFDILTDGHGVYPVNRPEAPTHETLDGTSTDDVMIGTAKDSYMRGFAGNDTIDGRDGHDTIFGARGDDVLYGRRGIDTLDGGAGNDRLYGGGRNDTLNGGSGHDFLSGGRGNDRLTGGTGRDIFHFDENFGRDRVTDFEIGKDQLHLDFAGADFESLSIRRGGGGTVIETIQGTIVLEGILPHDLSASDFMF